MLESRTFTFEDQLRFAVLTGDFNPVHVDPLTARRTQAGAPVVHGIHALLWLLDILAVSNADLPAVGAIAVLFPRMIYVGDQVKAAVKQRNTSMLRAEVTVDGTAAVELTITFGLGSAPVSALPLHRPVNTDLLRDTVLVPRPETPLNRPLEQMDGWSGAFASENLDDMERMFPHAARLLGVRRLVALGCSTLLVGMIIPGLNSLYAGLAVIVCEDGDTAGKVAFRVSRVDPRVRLVRLDIYGGGLLGTVEAFVRHPPVAQATLDTVSSVVARDEFAGITALIVGGSRGLGELTARVLAVGGGNVVITYAVGKAEADALAAEITAWGGRCKVIGYDVRQDAVQQLSVITEVPTHIYYFSTPRIFRARSSRLFSPDRFQEFNDFYVTGFLRLVEASLQRWPDGFSAFYPSSVAVQDRPAGMAEYAMSKAAGEILCAEISAQIPKARITVCRLPRLLTDQTATLGQPTTPDSLGIMVPLIRDFS